MTRRADIDARTAAEIARRLEAGDVAERLAALLGAVQSTGARAWLVGGTVRDLLLGADRIADVDVVIDRDSLEFARRIADERGWSFVLLDEPRGTGRIVTTSGAHIDVNALVGDSIEDDLRQRDITINAIALSIEDERFGEAAIDPCGGIDDLEDELIRLTSPTAVVDDPLRLLRVFRFSTTLGFVIVPETLDAVSANAPLLADVAPERVVTELTPILEDAASAAVFRRMDEVGLLEATLPELGQMRGIEQNEFHHLDVLGHSLLTLDRLERLLADLGSVFGEHAENVDAFLGEKLTAGRTRLMSVKLAALLHDIGKPATRSTEIGRTTFYQHNAEGAELARETSRRLRLSNAETDEIGFYVHAHMVPGDVEKSAIESAEGASQGSVVRFVTRRGERGLVLALLSVADSMAMAGPRADQGRPERLRRFARRAAAAYYDEVRPRIETPPLVSGGEIIKHFGLEPGPQIGAVLEGIRKLQLEGCLTTRDEALVEAERLVTEAAAEPNPAAD
jgi:poly(A) polymerase